MGQRESLEIGAGAGKKQGGSSSGMEGLVVGIGTSKKADRCISTNVNSGGLYFGGVCASPWWWVQFLSQEGRSHQLGVRVGRQVLEFQGQESGRRKHRGISVAAQQQEAPDGGLQSLIKVTPVSVVTCFFPATFNNQAQIKSRQGAGHKSGGGFAKQVC